MKSKIIPSELLSVAGTLLRQARTARTLSVEQAALRIGLSKGYLTLLESGECADATADHVIYILAAYGGVRNDAAERLFIRLMFEESRCRVQTETRKHLSIAGEADPRPWERMNYNQISSGI